MSSVSNGLYFLTLPLVSVMRVIYQKIRHARYLYIKRNVEKVRGARYTLGARYLSKKYGNWNTCSRLWLQAWLVHTEVFHCLNILFHCLPPLHHQPAASDALFESASLHQIAGKLTTYQLISKKIKVFPSQARCGPEGG